MLESGSPLLRESGCHTPCARRIEQTSYSSITFTSSEILSIPYPRRVGSLVALLVAVAAVTRSSAVKT